MNLTQMLKNWAVENCDVKADASDDEFKKAIGEALVTGKLTTEKFTELSTEKEETQANDFQKSMAAMAEGMGQLTTAVKTLLEKPKEEPKKEEKAEEGKKEDPKPKEKEEGKDEPKEKGATNLDKKVAKIGGDGASGDDDVKVRVKAAVEMYDTSRKTLTYPETDRRGGRHQFRGMPVQEFGRTLNTPSDLDKAAAGVWAKFLINTDRRGGVKRFGWESLSEHEKGILDHMCENMEWDDSDNERSRIRKGYPGGRKDLIDDATSGGLEAAPIVFDDQVIQAPLLYGELYPLVNTIVLARGRRVEGVATGKVTGTWGGVDATAITLFNTNNYVTAFDTTIYRWEGAIRIGLDFLSDTPIDFGAHITAQYGERLLEDLDDVVAAGNGTTQPQGVINTAGGTAVVWGAATSIGNYESLRFSVPKNEHGAAVKSSAVFCGTETSYQRALAIPVGGTDVRRLSNTMVMPNYDGYQWMQRPYKINESLTNAQIFYAIMARYRMYRRRGLTLRTSTEGDTLIRNNEMLIVAHGRYGGQMERGACCGLVTDAPA